MRSVKHGGKKQTRYRYKRNTTNAKTKAMKKKRENQTNWLTNAAFTGYRLTPHPEVAAQWDKRLTLKQNMDNMGIAYDVNKAVKAPKPKAKKDPVVEEVPMEVVAEVSSVAQQKAEAANKNKESKKAEKEPKGKKAKPVEVVEEPMIQEPQPSKPQTKAAEPPKEKEQKKEKQKEKQKEVEQPKPQQKEQKKGKKAAPVLDEEQPMDAEDVAPPVVVNHVSHSTRSRSKEQRKEETTVVTTTTNSAAAVANNTAEKVKQQASVEKAEKQTKAEKAKQAAAAPATITNEASKAAEKTKPAAAPATTKEAPKSAEKTKPTAAPNVVADKPKPVIAALEKAAAEEEARQKKERMYRLLPQDILFCTRMMETHGDDYEAMARDQRNVYQDTAKQVQRKIRIFRESPQFQLYLDAKKEGKAYPNGDIEAK